MSCSCGESLFLSQFIIKHNHQRANSRRSLCQLWNKLMVNRRPLHKPPGGYSNLNYTSIYGMLWQVKPSKWLRRRKILLLLMQTTSNTRQQQNLVLILMIVKKLKLTDICIFVGNESYVFVQLSRKMSNFEISPLRISPIIKFSFANNPPGA